MGNCVKSTIMGNCVKSTDANEGRGARSNRLVRPKPWRHEQRISWGDLTVMRDQFWRTAPQCYGGQARIWEALQDAADMDLHFAQAILDANSIRLGDPPDMSVCYDDRGHRYELPAFVLSEPSNMIKAIDRPRIIDRILRRPYLP